MLRVYSINRCSTSTRSTPTTIVSQFTSTYPAKMVANLSSHICNWSSLLFLTAVPADWNTNLFIQLVQLFIWGRFCGINYNTTYAVTAKLWLPYFDNLILMSSFFFIRPTQLVDFSQCWLFEAARRFTWRHYPDSLMLMRAWRRSIKCQFYSLLFDRTGARTHDLPRRLRGTR